MKNTYKIITFVLMLFGINTLIYAKPNCDTLNVDFEVDTVINIKFDEDLFNFTTSSPPEDELKAVYWVHGMNGNLKSWETAANVFEDRYKILSIRPEYGENQNTWSNAWHNLYDDINEDWNFGRIDENGSPLPPTKDRVVLHEKSFGIGHSLGGVALRKVSMEYDPEAINGIVTVDSPHGGSLLAQYVIPAYEGGVSTPEYEDFKNTIATYLTELIEPPILEKAKQSFVVKAAEFLGVFKSVDIIENSMEKIIENTTPLVIKNIAPKAVNVLEPNSSELNWTEQIDEYVNDAGEVESKRAAFYGDVTSEDPYAHNSAYKMFYSGAYSPSDYEPFTAQKQHKVATEMLKHNRILYFTKNLFYKTLYSYKPSSIFGCWIPWAWDVMFNVKTGQIYCECCNCVLNCDDYTGMDWDDVKTVRNKYKKGFDAFDKFNDYWEQICGATEYSVNNESTLGTCRCGDIHHGYTVTENTYNSECIDDSSIPNLCIWTPYQEITKYKKPYDGFLTVESQTAWNTHNKIPKIKLKDSNHLNVRNNREVEKGLTELFDGTYGTFFRTKKR